jgi:hypothetical protein
MHPDLLRNCPACGATIVAGASRCGNCGEDLSGSQAGPDRADTPSSGRSDRTTATPPKTSVSRSPLDARDGSERPGSDDVFTTVRTHGGGRVTLEGTVNRLQSRPAGQLETWTFQLELAAAYQGAPKILVQAGPSSMQGSLHDGERVRVTGKFKDGLLHANRLFSYDHRADVGPRTSPVSWILGAAVALIFVLTLAAAFGWCTAGTRLRTTTAVTD